MDSDHFDRLTRAVSIFVSRRKLAGTLGLAALARPDLGVGKKRKKRKKKKVAFNDFGCVNVGGFCKDSSQCCSGVCKGKKGKKKCKAHDSDGCTAGSSPVGCGGTSVPCTTSNGVPGQCMTTTGNAGYCGTGGDCFSCTKDADCRLVCGPRAACVRCEEACTVGTVCMGPGACAFG